METRLSVLIRIVKTGYILLSAVMCTLGLLFILLPEESTQWLSFVCGILLIVCGAVRIIGYFSGDIYRLAFQYDLEFGIIMLVTGVVLLLHRAEFILFMGIVFGIVILADSLFKIRTAFDAKKFGLKSWWLILLLALVTALIGISMIVTPSKAAQGLSVWIGISLLFEGVTNLIVAIFTVKI